MFVIQTQIPLSNDPLEFERHVTRRAQCACFWNATAPVLSYLGQIAVNVRQLPRGTRLRLKAEKTPDGVVFLAATLLAQEEMDALFRDEARKAGHPVLVLREGNA